MAKKKYQEKTFVSPYPKAYSFSPVKEEPKALKTDLTTLHQIRKDEGTLIWGDDDAMPLRILNAIAESPTTSSCIGKMEMFTRGSGFEDAKLMKLVVNDDGDTLWQHHCEIVKYFCSLDGFTTNFKFDSESKITNSYVMNLSGVRFKAEAETSEITGIKYNPYFGTGEYKKAFSKEYSLFSLEKLPDQIKKQGTKFNGQVYFHPSKSPLYKHYPVPKFWAGKKWIYSDAKLSTYIDKLLDNGFFQSVLMNVIGDPNKMSQHPDSMQEITGTDGIVRTEATLTEGEVFDRMMGEQFSGVEKTAKAFVTWSLNHDEAVKIQAFPTTTNFDFVSGTLREVIRMISISTEVPGILANLPDEVSPLSGGDSMKHAIDFMQSVTEDKRSQLEAFYNNILLPNLQKPPKNLVKIKPYQPTKIQVTVDKQFWDFMNEAEKIDFIEKNEPSITIQREPAAADNMAPATLDENGNAVPAPTVPQVDEILKGLKVSEINRILSIVKKVNSGQLTAEQAKTILSGYGLNEEQINAFLNPNPLDI